MDMNAHTDLATLAAQFVNRTSQHIFLTGKAGTGKTTFLRKMAESTHKRFVIVAPTGIAALNAQGVTIHSQFLLPPGTFIPDRNPEGDFGEDHFIYTQSTLTRRNPLNAQRKQVLRDIELLIIDEVSMLRADLLDAIDFRLRSARRNFRQAFGGVQVIMIGDLYQLPPIVKDGEWKFLRRYYNSAHFFEAKALQTEGYSFIELDKIYRQQDDQFIRILNNLRNNCPTADDIAILNSRLRTETEIRAMEDVVTLTTHNYKADDMNQQALKLLRTASHTFDAEIEGDFPENIYPVLGRIELKEGAQIMFIKNDSDGTAYFNGKLARVVRLDSEEDLIEVEMSGDKQRYVLKKETWQNKRYTVNASTREMEEDVIGTFTQYPIRLAWAITVHKSQGLTFDRAVIDVGQAFATGQVYVALSRLRSLDGLIMRTQIDPAVIATDPQVVAFSAQKQEKENLATTLKEKQADYLLRSLHDAFDFSDLIAESDRLMKLHTGTMEFEDATMQAALAEITEALRAESENLRKFRGQISSLIHAADYESLCERLEKGTAYFDQNLRAQLKKLLVHAESAKRFARTKTYVSDLAELDLLLTRKRQDAGRSAYLARCIAEGKDIERTEASQPALVRDRVTLLEFAREEASKLNIQASGKTGKKRTAKTDKEKPEKPKGKLTTLQQTLLFHKQGLNAEEIAQKRGLAVSTILGHFAQAVQSAEIPIESIMSSETIAAITELIESSGAKSLGQLMTASNGQFTYQELKLVQAHLSLTES
jgi:dephospho-CoA kinase